MKIVMITQENQELFYGMIPKSLLRKNVSAIGCLEKENAAGAIVLEMGMDDYTISFFWVEPEYRGKDVGGRLLDAAIEYAVKTGAEELTISYDSNHNQAVVLEYLLAKRRFDLQREKIPNYIITREQLEASPLMTDIGKKYKGNNSVIPVRNLTTYQIIEMRKRYEDNRKFMVSRLDLLGVDAKKSMALVVDDVVRGIVLFKQGEEWGRLNLLLFFVEASCVAGGVSLLMEAAKNILKESEEVFSIEFACVNEKSFLLAERLLGNCNPVWIYMSHGILETEIYKR
ncbi:MAG: GNAT family N-acetyltransferase [Clostridiales bacterium]|nr:GNAT family N-acetyltransferase [Clostridiales bacterium]